MRSLTLQSVWLLVIVFLAVTQSVGQSSEILLWPKGAPGSEGKTTSEKVRIAETGDHVVSGIHNPSITPFYHQEIRLLVQL